MSESKCPYCSTDLINADDFCPDCGWYLKQAAPEHPRVVESEIGETRIFLVLSPHEKYKISKTRTTLGRDMGDIVIAEDLELSRLHCEFIYKDHKLYVKDLDSHNGVFIGDRRIPPDEEIPLQPEDKLKIGANTYTLEFKSDEGTGEEIGGIVFYLKAVSDGREYQLRLGENMVGRGEFSHVRIMDAPYVAREHAVIALEEVSGKLGLLELKIMDKGSVNGTLLNGVAIPPYKWQKLIEGDEISFADAHFKVISKPREK